MAPGGAVAVFSTADVPVAVGAVPLRPSGSQRASTGDAHALAQIAHNLKSGSRNLGARELGQLCERLEHLARHGDVAGAAALATPVHHEFLLVRPLLEVEIAHH